MELQAKRAVARLLEAHSDLQVARSLAKKVPSRSIFHSQQCVEKALKACLSKVIIGDIKIHPVVKLLHEKILTGLSSRLQRKFQAIETDAFWVERRWIDTRYEEVTPEGEVRTPVLQFTAVDAERGVAVARKVLSWSVGCINEVFQLKLPKSHAAFQRFAIGELSRKEE